jgi:hypothetical protein
MGTEHMAEKSYEIEEEWIKGLSLCHPNDTEIEVVRSCLMANRQRRLHARMLSKGESM